MDESVIKQMKVVPHYGVDEAGRGCLNGPVVVAAVKLDENAEYEFDDSKALSKKQRDALYDKVFEVAQDVCVFEVTPQEIDERNVLQATLYGMGETWLRSQRLCNTVYVDGNKVPNIKSYGAEVTSVVKGDRLFSAISAASIVAKVHRDRLMDAMDKEYPDMCYAKHKGYPTALHLEKMQQFGINDSYRKTFGPVRPFVEDAQMSLLD